MHELDVLYARVDSLAPFLGDVLEATGVDRTPDLELPTLWMADLGHAVALSLDRLTPETAKAIFALFEDVLATGSEFAGTCVATGLLEGLASGID